MGEEDKTESEESLPQKFDPTIERMPIPDGGQGKLEITYHDPDIKASDIKIRELNVKHDLQQKAAENELARKIEAWNLRWTRAREIIFYIVLFFSVFQCWKIATDSQQSSDAQKAAIGAGTTLVTGTIGFFIGKQAASTKKD